MPRNVDPGSIRVGKGLAPEGTVEDNSIRYPERDVDPLRVHLHDPSRSHMAATVGIVDEADCYVSDEVEGALQEICAGASAGRLNGLVSGGTFDELGNVANGTGSVATTSLTLETTTEIMVGAGVFDASALVADLTGLGAGDYYVYFDTNSSSPTFRTLLVGGAPPEVETGAGIEDVLLAKITYDAGGNVTAWQDGRFFVRNLDRKVQYSSRQGENVDAWSEGCFATLQAFFLWMAEYGEGTGTPSEEEKGTVLIRGRHDFTVPLVVPANHLQFIGDGNAVLMADNGFSGSHLVDISGRSNLLFRNITFETRVASLTGIFAATSPNLSRIRVEDCVIGRLGAPFDVGVNLSTPGRTGSDLRISGTTFVVDSHAMRLDGLEDVTVTGCAMGGPGANVLSVGIETGHLLVGGSDLVISESTVTDFASGFRLNNIEKVRASGNNLSDVAVGIESFSGSGGALLCTAFSITGNTIDLDSLHGVSGVTLREVTSSDIEANTILGTHGTPGTPYGIDIDTVATGPGLGGVSLDIRILGNNIKDFLDSSFQGAGIRLLGSGGLAFNNPLSGVVVTGNTLNECGIIVENEVTDFVISGNVLDGFISTSTEIPTSAAIQFTPDNALEARAVRGSISGNQIRRFGDGLLVVGTDNQQCEGIKITDNMISEIAHTQDNQTDTFAGIGTKAIGLDRCRECDVTGNTIRSVGSALDDSGNPVVFVGNIWSLGIYVRDSEGYVTTADNHIGQSTSAGAGTLVGAAYTVGAGAAAQYEGYNHVIKNNNLQMDDPDGASDVGVLVNIGDSVFAHSFTDMLVEGNTVEAHQAGNEPRFGFLFQTFEYSTGFQRGGIFDGIRVLNNSVRVFSRSGVYFRTNGGANQLRPSGITNVAVRGNRLYATSPTGADQNGVGFITSAITEASVVDGVVVADNDIQLPIEPDVGRDNHGVFLVSIGNGSSATCRRVSVTGNRIPKIKQGTAVYLERFGPHDTTQHHDWDVSRNRIGLGEAEPSSGSHPTKGVDLLLGPSGMIGLHVHDNQITVDKASSHLTLVGDSGGLGADHVGWSICNNQCGLGGATVTGATTSMGVTLTDANLQGFQFLGNMPLAQNGNTVGFGLDFVMGNTTGSAFRLQHVNVQSNTCASGGIRFSLGGINVDRVSISDNIVQGFVSDDVLSSPLHFKSDLGVGGVSCSLLDVSITGNTVRGGTAGIHMDSDSVSSQTNVKVSGNTVSGQTPFTTGLTTRGYSILYEIRGTLNASTATNITVDDNLIHESGDPIDFLFEANPQQLTLRGLSVCGNRLVQRGGSVMEVKLLPSVGFVSEYVNVRVDRNVITGLSSTLYPLNGLLFAVSSSAGEQHHIHNVSVSENQIDVSFDGGSVTRALFAQFLQVDSEPMSVCGLNVDANRITVFKDPNNGVPSYCSALEVELTCHAQDVSASENRIDYQDEGNPISVLSSPFDYGVRLYHDFTPTEGDADANSPTQYLIGSRADALQPLARWDLWYDIQAVGSRRFLPVRWDSVRVSNNDIRFPAGGSNNGPAALSIAPTQISGDDRMTVCLWGFAMSGNVVRSCKQNYKLEAPYLGNDAALVGHWNIVLDYKTCWPGDGSGATAVTPNLVQSGWSITGNSVTDFCRLDAGAGTYAGHDVRVIGRDQGALLAWGEAVVLGNVTKDDGQGAASIPALNGDGFDRYQPSGLQPDHNREGGPRTY